MDVKAITTQPAHSVNRGAIDGMNYGSGAYQAYWPVSASRVRGVRPRKQVGVA